MGDHAIAQAGVAGLALDDAVAGEAAVGVVGEDEGEDGLAGGGGLRAVGADGHAVDDRGGAGEVESWRALYLDEAGAAAGVRREVIYIAEVGDEDAGVLDHLDEGRADRRLDLATVEGDRGHGYLVR